MVDLQKRYTLKVLSSTAALGGVTFGGTALSANYAATKSAKAINNVAANHLTVQVVIGDSVTENTVIFNNDSAATIVIDDFLPGLITLKNRMMDLNAITKNKSITVKPGYPVAITLAEWDVLNLDRNHSYLWCDNGVEHFCSPEHSNNKMSTHAGGVINIDAAVVNGRALLTLINPVFT